MERKQKRMLILLAVMTAIFLGLNIWTTFQQGYYLGGDFFKRREQGGTTAYTGQYLDEGVTITVTGTLGPNETVDIDLTQSGGARRSYQLICGGGKNAGAFDLTVSESGNEIFNGTYRPGEALAFVDTDGQPALNSIVTVSESGEPLKLSLSELTALAGHASQNQTRQWLYFIGGLPVLAVILIDVAFPRAFFTLSHGLAVRDAEPSDLYLSLQKLGRRVSTALLAILWLVGLMNA